MFCTGTRCPPSPGVRSVAAMMIAADRSACVGAGQCVMTAPDLFDQDDDGIVTLLDPTATGAEQEARRAVSLCPARAIRIVED
jgi:ferredoxin